jgi:hypothetical protein
MRIMSTRLLMTLCLPGKQIPTALPKSHLSIAALGESHSDLTLERTAGYLDLRLQQLFRRQ